MVYAMDLFDLELGLDSLDAYVSRRRSHQSQRTVGSVLTQVHKVLAEQAAFADSFGDDVDDF
jgi:hypothetical protein